MPGSVGMRNRGVLKAAVLLPLGWLLLLKDSSDVRFSSVSIQPAF